MPYVDTMLNINNENPSGGVYKVREAFFASDLANILMKFGWTLKVNFNKVCIPSQFAPGAYGGIPDPNSFMSIAVGEHFIFESGAASAADKTYFGVATLAYWTEEYGLIPVASQPHNSMVEFGKWAADRSNGFQKRGTLYFYVLEDLKGLETKLDAEGNLVLSWTQSSETGLTNCALDIEITGTEWVPVDGIQTWRVKPDGYDPYRMQSPIVPAGFRLSSLEDFYNEALKMNVYNTNWWYDSEISVRGYVDSETVFLIMQSDNVPAFELNKVPSIPFYFGRLDPFDPNDKACAMFAGSVPPGVLDVSTFNYDDEAIKFDPIFPVMKNYPAYPANGIEQVMLSRSKQGARYQAYYLSWNAPSNNMPPSRSNGSKDYPRATSNFQTDIYKYQFNPSLYTGKVHTSKIYVVHPEEGVRGSLTKVLALPAINFNAQKLRVRQDGNCADPRYDVYRYAVVDGVSPLTKRPGTPFRPAGVGIFSHVEDKDGNLVN
ncbi:hypothetical protein G3578_09165 [Brevibacillus sp. SYP-B805]|uniref:hypothetical protein n=1 Tax=Brevibacillus sp. SYP-B805 TaxID=1578199 RepID=UPI0013EB7586|nr:hypothetical protein [Brevibacillus sp. SYP-B805]NGQ95323.1 hypothetical protein [Brevibacillus sp. SYP-B805]